MAMVHSWSKMGLTPAVALSVVLLYFALALAGEGYFRYCRWTGGEAIYDRGEMSERFSPPSSEHWFGTDYQGRSVFWRSLFAVRTAVKVGVIASAISSLIGVLLGVCAGYFRGWIDDVVVWIYSTFASMPTLLFILAFALLVGKGLLFPPLTVFFAGAASMLGTDVGMLAVYLGIGLTGWVGLCRVVRAETMRLRESQYVLAARVVGARSPRIIFRHIIPNLTHLIIIYFTMRFAFAIMTEVIVSYLGLGVETQPSWGTMIADGQSRLWQGIWWEVAAATMMMFFLVLCLHLLGDALRDYLDPKTEGGRR